MTRSWMIPLNVSTLYVNEVKPLTLQLRSKVKVFINQLIWNINWVLTLKILCQYNSLQYEFDLKSLGLTHNIFNTRLDKTFFSPFLCWIYLAFHLHDFTILFGTEPALLSLKYLFHGQLKNLKMECVMTVCTAAVWPSAG